MSEYWDKFLVSLPVSIVVYIIMIFLKNPIEKFFRWIGNGVLQLLISINKSFARRYYVSISLRRRTESSIFSLLPIIFILGFGFFYFSILDNLRHFYSFSGSVQSLKDSTSTRPLSNALNYNTIQHNFYDLETDLYIKFFFLFFISVIYAAWIDLYKIALNGDIDEMDFALNLIKFDVDESTYKSLIMESFNIQSKVAYNKFIQRLDHIIDEKQLFTNYKWGPTPK